LPPYADLLIQPLQPRSAVFISQRYAMAHLGEVAPLNLKTLNRFPGGADGMMAYSQLSKYWDYVHQMMSSDPESSKKMEEGLAQFELQTGISVSRDVVPALNGNFVLAVYPDARGAQT